MRKVNYLQSGKIYLGTLEGGEIISQSCNRRVAIPVYQVQLLPPVIKPGKIICVGLNYPPLAKSKAWTSPPYPVLFHKTASSLIGFGSAIQLPKISQQVLYEGELAVVIGTRGKNIPVDQSLKFVDGYTIANDVGAPDIESRSSQWASGKMFDTFCPLGPAMVTPEEIPDPGNLFIKTTLNGKIVQDSNTREMIFDVPFLISYISQLTTLEPGDLILTGSPKRAGDVPDPRTPLRQGDSISIEIEGLGTLTNQVIAEEL
jgi:acylpyruvate hydrolase